MIKKLTTDFVFSGVYYYVLVFALKKSTASDSREGLQFDVYCLPSSSRFVL